MADGSADRRSRASAPACARWPTSPTSRSRRSRASSPAPGRQRRDARPGHGRGRRARIRARLPGPEPAPRRDAVGRLRRRRHLEPADRDDHLGRRIGAPVGRLLDAADELGERSRPRRRAHPVLPGATGRRDDPVARQRAPPGDPRHPRPGRRPDHPDRPRRARSICGRAWSATTIAAGCARPSTTSSTSAIGGSRSITGGLDLWPVRERIAGMAGAVAARGVRTRRSALAESLSAEHGEREHRAAAGDGSATDRHRGRRQPGPRRLHPRPSGPRDPGPGRLSLVTCDEVDLSELHDRRSRRSRATRCCSGRTAAELLLERLAGGEPRTVLSRRRSSPVPSTPAPGHRPADPRSLQAVPTRAAGPYAVGNVCRTATSVR